MTFCLGMIVEDGIVGIADTRITTGSEIVTAKKVTVYPHGRGSMFVMTSGLRSLRDKTLTYFEEHLSSRSEPFDRLYKAVNTFTDQLRQVAKEDRDSLIQGGLHFDMYAVIAGQMENDREHLMYLVYPQGNWVEIGKGTPYQIIGSPAYGKPVLDRTLRHTDNLRFALKVGCLAFDSTRISAVDVDYPIDVVIYSRATRQTIEHRYHKKDIADISDWWQERLRTSVRDLPAEWIERIFTNVLPNA